MTCGAYIFMSSSSVKHDYEQSSNKIKFIELINTKYANGIQKLWIH